jgi:uncharacterized membrane protein YjjB (DUF3815 family)
MKESLLQLLYAFIGSLGFALLFKLKPKRLLPASLGGLFTWGVYLLVKWFGAGIFFSTLVAAAFASLLSELLARLLKAPTTVFTIPAVVPLIPGSSLYYTMQCAVSSDIAGVKHYAVETLLFILGITLGLSAVSAIFAIITKNVKRTNDEKRR